MSANGRKLETLGKAERYLAREQILRTLARLPDPELVRIAAARDTEALAACGITESLLRSAVGDSEDPEEQRRRLSALFEPLRQRADRLKPFLTPEVDE